MSLDVIERLETALVYPELALPVQDEVEPQTQLSNWRITRLFGGLMIAQALTEHGIFDDTPRIYGVQDSDELLTLPHYKVRTMTDEVKAQAEYYRSIGEFVKGVHDKRPGIRGLLAKLSLDEVPVYPLMGGSWLVRRRAPTAFGGTRKPRPGRGRRRARYDHD